MHPSTCRAGAMFVFAVLSVVAASAKPVLHIIRPLRGTHFTVPADISANGRALALNSERTNFSFQALRQVRPNSPKPIPLNIPSESTANGISADGSVVVGWSYNAASLTRGYRWTKETGTVDLSPDPDLYYFCTGVSGDGRVAVGAFLKPINLYQPFFWSAETGFQPLDLSGNDTGYVSAANHDGNVIVGNVTTNAGRTGYACRWVKMGKVELLDPSATDSYANAVTPDGSIIVGGNSAGLAFYWARSFGLQWVQPGNAFRSVTFSGVSADGTHFVGYGITSDNLSSGIFSSDEYGLKDLNELFGSLLPRGWRFFDAAAISADGRWIVGTLEGPNEALRGYMLDTGRRK